jgi:hypothetical protein
MKLAENCLSQLQSWLDSGTWHTGHELDMNRFYAFVDACARQNDLDICDESILTKTIVLQANIKTEDPRYPVIKERVSLMCNILDFLKTTNR